MQKVLQDTFHNLDPFLELSEHFAELSDCLHGFMQIVFCKLQKPEGRFSERRERRSCFSQRAGETSRRLESFLEPALCFLESKDSFPEHLKAVKITIKPRLG